MDRRRQHANVLYLPGQHTSLARRLNHDIRLRKRVCVRSWLVLQLWRARLHPLPSRRLHGWNGQHVRVRLHNLRAGLHRRRHEPRYC